MWPMIVRVQVHYPAANKHSPSFLLTLRLLLDPPLLSHSVGIARARLLEYLNLRVLIVVIRTRFETKKFYGKCIQKKVLRQEGQRLLYWESTFLPLHFT